MTQFSNKNIVQQPKAIKNFRNFIIGIDEAGRAAHKMSEPRPAFIIGIDEAGRGPLAGPVVVGGIRIKSKIKNQNVKFWKDFKTIRDSKKLSAKQREKWFLRLTARSEIKWAFAKISPGIIDRINIAQASNLGARRVYKKLNKVTSQFHSKNNNTVRACREHTLLDGGLKLPAYIPHEVIIKGDENIPIIAAASIIAKVVRDRTMLRLHKKYPQYRFDLHKGYGTKLHKNLLKKFGRSDIHRKSFKT